MNRAQPDSIVLVFPTPWEADESRLLREVHEEFWIEELEPTLNEEDGVTRGSITLADGAVAEVVPVDLYGRDAVDAEPLGATDRQVTSCSQHA